MLLKEISALKDQLKKAKGAINESWEWVDHYGQSWDGDCPECRIFVGLNGHKEDCKLGNWLKQHQKRIEGE